MSTQIPGYETPTLPFAAPVMAPPPRRDVALPRPGGREVPLPLLAGAGALLTIATLLALKPFAGSYLGTLLLQRGWMQYASVFLAWTALAILAARAVRVSLGWSDLRNAPRLPELGAGERADAACMAELRDRWARMGGAAALRRARALNAYLGSGSRAAAAQVAEDDTAQAEAALDSGYSIPRVLVWAIPLFGFIGTVVGISAAVAGFSGFLQTAEEIEQIKKGIGGVTTGLAVAFDTTLLALALSVAVMLPLVLLERMERRVVLALDADTMDAVVTRLPDAAQGVDEAAVRRAVDAALAAALPRPEALVEPARVYLERAGHDFAASVAQASHALVQAGEGVAQAQRSAAAESERQHAALRERLEARDRDFLRVLAHGAETLRTTQAAAVVQVREEGQAAAARLAESSAAVAAGLDRAATELGRRVAALETLSAHTSEAVALEQSLQRTVDALQRAGRLSEVLAGVEGSLRELRPALARLAQPRRIMLVEGDTPVLVGGGDGAA
ncbi:MAG TPA: MotA/TolQ/ExbB proton channel family protein [Longimicrobium sp.]|nr:MotA/TolQ/ExbB proton channel family protein [Longimicrobium sp.]